MATRKRKVNRSTTERLAQLIEAELGKQDLTPEEAAREGRLPEKAFQSLLRNGHRPTIDRAEELCRAIGITMTIGGKPETENGDPVEDEDDQRGARK